MSIKTFQRQCVFSLIQAIEEMPGLEPFMTEDQSANIIIGLSGTDGIYGYFPVNNITEPTKTDKSENDSKTPLTCSELILLSNNLATRIEKLVEYDNFVNINPNCDVTLMIRIGEYEYNTELGSPDHT